MRMIFISKNEELFGILMKEVPENYCKNDPPYFQTNSKDSAII